jgi:acyl-CoA synthetase (AMP-forming)/AMP-acid ligase II
MSPDDMLLARIRERSESDPDGVAFRFFRRHDDAGEPLSWSELWIRASSIARELHAAGCEPGQAILDLCHDERNFIAGMIASWMVGAVSVPAAGGGTHLFERNLHILERSRPEIILHDLDEAGIARFGQHFENTKLVSALGLDPGAAFHPEVIDSGSNGLLQFTSGSTSKPKAILLTHRNLAANCQAINSAYQTNSASVGVHWLPLNHDMGLVGSVLAALWSGVQSIVMRPSVFIQKPSLWFRLISDWRGTITSAPNFAYERLCQLTTANDLAGLDLSCLQNVVMGAEPVQQATIEKLLETFEPAGLARSAIAPSYGLAEVTLLASSGKRLEGPIYSNRHTRYPVTGLGGPVEGVEITIRDETTRSPLEAGSLGQIWLSGLCAGRVIAETEDWRIQAQGSDINTGDYGFFENGSLFVTGRNANKIIIRGRNYFAEDIEALVKISQPQGYSSGIAAFGVDQAGTQALCILIEQVQRKDVIDMVALNREILMKLGVKPGEVTTLRRSTLPRTSSGKIRREAARDEYLENAYERKVLSRVVQIGH